LPTLINSLGGEEGLLIYRLPPFRTPGLLLAFSRSSSRTPQVSKEEQRSWSLKQQTAAEELDSAGAPETSIDTDETQHDTTNQEHPSG